MRLRQIKYLSSLRGFESKPSNSDFVLRCFTSKLKTVLHFNKFSQFELKVTYSLDGRANNFILSYLVKLQKI